MKIQIALIAAVLLAGCAKNESADDTAAPVAADTPSEAAGPAAPTASDMNMDAAEHQKMADGAAAMGMTPEAHAAMGKGADTAATTPAKGVGVVKSIDSAAGKVTLDHEPIAELKWPAMTMAFKASPELLAAVKAGDRVEFEFTQGADGSTLSVLQPRK